MTHVYVKICDLCGNPSEINSMMHAGTVSADVMINNFNIYREEFDVCVNCLKDTGLADILLKMKEQKESNKDKAKKAEKLLKLNQKYIERKKPSNKEAE